jgi:hypothetical protein
MIVSDQQIEYHVPGLSGPLTQSYTRQGQQVRIAPGTLDARVETITKLTAQTLGLQITRKILPTPTSFVRDFLELNYTYIRQ